ncbi:MAG: DNA repair protein RadC [Rickettsiaceae bacterium]|nr:DNA repair protein RadC [Rickettsiaceae bacterium]
MSDPNLNQGHRKRLKDRFTISPSAVHDYELLELILFNAIPRRDVKNLAKTLIKKCGGFPQVINLDEVRLKDLQSEMGKEIPKSLYTQFAIIKESIARILSDELKEREILGRSAALNDYLLATMSNKNTESFRVLYLNTKNHLIAEEIQDVGTVDQTQVYPREIVKKAIFHGASAIILVHNHPSGIATPSKADIIITNKIIEACKTIEVAVHDHVIVGSGRIYSFRSNGII